MGLIGRNETCYCGSGKKYKKCCLKYDEKQLNKGIIPKPANEAFDIARTSHNIQAGIRELALAQLEQIIIWLSKKHVQPHLIQVNSKDLYELSQTDDMVEHYLHINREVLLAQGSPNMHLELQLIRERAETFPSLTKNERTLIRTIAEANIGEFLLLGDAHTADYSAMKILTEFCYEAIKEGIPDRENLISAILYVDSDGENNEKLVNWELGYVDDDEPVDTIWIEWEALDELNDEYRKYAHSLHGLEEDSKDELATAMYLEKTLPYKSKNHISYRGLIMTYTSILERELKKLIESKEGSIPEDWMMKKINDYILKHPLTYLENVNNLYEQLENIRRIRNKAAHGEKIDYEDFEIVKDLLIDQQLMEFISWAKVELEDLEVDSKLTD
ncbi:hypothetical protein GGQ92_002418 [Gracilibacillus halotolerans]|uniref:SEC-C motif-containing protein n=1 Tax=Gracilibacillus halotolerans TaxID=74386 RepID=A0A841RRN3_9BACI|nr:SEC-C metal-binding domain-containing protein [Gracilibacillus halotolerans]MBB6513604.1 hypothetical protein [Gracilibacillus halotolerans]